MAYRCVQGHWCAKKYAGKRCPDCSSPGAALPTPQFALTATSTGTAVAEPSTPRYDEWASKIQELIAERETSTELIPAVEMAEALNAPTPLLVSTAELVAQANGAPKEEASGYLHEALGNLPPLTEPDMNYADDVTILSVLEHCLQGTVEYGNGPAQLLQQVKDGAVVFTQRELVALMGVQLLIEERQYEDALAGIPEGTDWVPHMVNRKCTLCGQFIGERSSHIKCPGEAPRKIQEQFEKGSTTVRGRVTRRKLVIPKDLFYHDTGIDVYPLRGLDGTEEEIEDLYFLRFKEHDDIKVRGYGKSFNGNGHVSSYAKEAIMSYLDPPLLAGTPVLRLPSGLRASFVENPLPSRVKVGEEGKWEQGGDTYSTLGYGNFHLIRLVAATIEPPLEQGEISHLIETGGEVAVKALLDVKRTSAITLRLLESEPSHAGRIYAATGLLSTQTLDAMVNSPDIFVAIQAAGAPNLTSEQLQSLATHPHPDVRAALLTAPDVGFEYVTSSALSRHPELLSTFVNDPDEELALRAFQGGKRYEPKTFKDADGKALGPFYPDRDNLPFTSHHLLAVTRVTSRKRLQRIAELVQPEQSSGGSGMQHGIDLTPDERAYRTKILAVIQHRLKS